MTNLILKKKTMIMGVLNVTPDSFSDGGKYFSSSKAVEHGLEMIEAGADIIDVGAESTSFYTDANKKPVEASVQIDRALPVIEILTKKSVKISIDTTNALVAQAALKAGACWINDQGAALKDNDMAQVMHKAEKVVLMHGFDLGFGVEAGEKITYSAQDRVMGELFSYFKERTQSLINGGLSPEQIIIDPGFGFGKGLKDSLFILKNLGSLTHLRMPILVGPSRKSFLGKISGIDKPYLRDNVSLAANVLAIKNGAEIIRTHNVKALAEARTLVDAVLYGEL